MAAEAACGQMKRKTETETAQLRDNVPSMLPPLPQRIKKLTTPSKDLKMRGKNAALSPYAANDAKLKADGKISTISEKETHF